MTRDSEYKELQTNNDYEKRKEYWEIGTGGARGICGAGQWQ